MKSNNNNSNQLSQTNKKQLILFVDDEKSVHYLISLMFQGNDNYEIISACTGEEAIELAKERGDQIDLLMLDVMLPDMDGGELYEKLQEKGITSSTPVIFQTGLTEPSQKIASLINKGKAVIIYKPYNKAELLAVIKKAFQYQELETLLHRGAL